ncbi:hypothetical protein GWK47_045634 [Chionoecetes opilio]|uniref:Uncharacterized protein n=1 Tax=Chionoecetes opilio TaxID=41210 RepID=A0A8J5CHG1_CHIOP|nr:hypothetical protein GWK47_045634 [Chionoecetes opilio]
MSVTDLLKPANKSRDTSQDNFTMAVSKELRGRKVDISEPPPAVQRQASRRPATRSATETFLIGYPSSSISGSQLPTNRQAFQYFLHLQSLPENTGNPKHQDLANETVEAIIPFWQMARIKTMTKYNAAQHFMTLHKKHRDLARNKGRTGDPGGKRSAFVLELDSLFDIGARSFRCHPGNREKPTAIKGEEGQGHQVLPGSEDREKGPHVWS